MIKNDLMTKAAVAISKVDLNLIELFLKACW